MLMFHSDLVAEPTYSEAAPESFGKASGARFIKAMGSAILMESNLIFMAYSETWKVEHVLS